MPKDVGSTRPRIDKLGVKAGDRVSLMGVDDADFVRELDERGADVSRRPRKDTNLVFLAIADAGEAARVAELERWLRRNGAIWLVYPRGRPELREADVIAAGVGAGFVDNKVVRFSDTHTALRFVIPLARR